ncbi:MAG: flavin reductase family protein [Pseudomonadota bacterium]
MQPRGLDRISTTDATQKDLRSAFGQFATGVTLVTALGPKGPVGMTANSFSSVSLEPALVLWCPAKSSSRYPAFAEATHFAIHVLAADQREVAMAFAKNGQAFDGLDVFVNDQDVPLLSDCLARFECRTRAVHDAGDHSIVLGEVTALATGKGEPLIFCKGCFGAFDK